MNGRVLIVEDHALLAIGLQLALSARGWDVETNNGSAAHDVIDHTGRFAPHCMLLDIQLTGSVGSGIDLIRPLIAMGTSVVMLTAETRRGVLAQCVEAGAMGWLPKDAFLDDVETTLRDVLAGQALIGRADRDALLADLRTERAGTMRELYALHRLTQREALVLAALMAGMTAEEIAEAHFVAVTTVRSQIRAVLNKLGVRSQLAAVAAANRVRWTLEMHQLAA